MSRRRFHPVETRRRALLLHGAGFGPSRVAAELGIPASTISNWIAAGHCPCGNPMSEPRARQCAACLHSVGPVWTRPLILGAIRRWARMYGDPPRAVDWNTAMARAERQEWRIVRYLAGDWPSTTTVQSRFGSWRAALEEAGFPAPTGRRRPVVEAA